MADPATSETKPYFLITIDTEGDDLWSCPKTITTRNAKYLPRFQRLCELYGVRPTYLTNYEMALSPVMQEFGKDLLKRNAGEIGMHLHAWNNPPLEPLTADDYQHQPFLLQFPDFLMREKLVLMTQLLEDIFQREIISHRAGRWGMDARYARLLIDCGYQVDCTVSPHVSWQHVAGDPRKPGGSDYTRFPEEPYFIDPASIDRAGNSTLLEVPVTIKSLRTLFIHALDAFRHVSPSLWRAVNHFFPFYHWLLPNGRNGHILLRLAQSVLREGRSHAEFTLHSSELMPGGSPHLATDIDIERVYHDTEQLFAFVHTRFTAVTLGEFSAAWRTTHPKRDCLHSPGITAEAEE